MARIVPIGIDAYSKDVYLEPPIMNNRTMDLSVMTHRKLRLRELLERSFGGSYKKMADQTAAVLDKGVSEDYIRKMLWPPHKSQNKPIGDRKQLDLEKAFGLERGWFDRPLGYAVPVPSSLPPTSPHNDSDVVRENTLIYLENRAPRPDTSWPFQSITREQWWQMSPAQREKIEIFAMGVSAAISGGGGSNPYEKRRQA